MVDLPRRLALRARNKLAAPLISRLDVLQASIIELNRDLGDTRGELRAVADRVSALGADISGLDEGTSRELDRIEEMLRHIYEDGPANRRRLHALRETDDYELAFTETEPLVSFILPTYKRYDTLRDVALPSILGQTYTNVEAIVVGDCAPPETAEVIAEMDDPRIRYYNRTVRGPYPGDDQTRWYMLGTPPYNDGLSLVRGRWITAMADDDAVRPTHTEALLRSAQETRVEHCYGRHMVHYQESPSLDLGSFPPEKGKFVMQASIYHSGLRFFQMGTSDYLYGEPNDWSYCRRMLEAGVRFGMIDDVVCDKYESRYLSHDDWGVYGIPTVD